MTMIMIMIMIMWQLPFVSFKTLLTYY